MSPLKYQHPPAPIEDVRDALAALDPSMPMDEPDHAVRLRAAIWRQGVEKRAAQAAADAPRLARGALHRMLSAIMDRIDPRPFQ